MWDDGPDPFRPSKSSWSPWWGAVAIGLIAAGVAFYRSGLRVEFDMPFEAFGARNTETQGRTPPGGSTPVAAPDGRDQAPHRVVEVATAPIDRTLVPRAEVAALPPTREIYLCKGYAGEMFWSSAQCSTQRALIDRIVTVPSHLSWTQAVEAGERQRQAVAPLYDAPQSTPKAPGGIRRASSSYPSPECALLKTQVEQMDAAARQGQYAATQDRLRRERQSAREREAQLGC